MDTFLTIIGLSALAIVGIAILLYVLLVIADWKIFTKAGEAGWKSLIPIYNEYIQFKISWNTKMFWVTFILTILTSCFAPWEDSAVCQIIAAVLGLVVLVIYIIAMYKLAKVFGHGVGYTILMIFFPNIMTLILGFGKDQYLGLNPGEGEA